MSAQARLLQEAFSERGDLETAIGLAVRKSSHVPLPGPSADCLTVGETPAYTPLFASIAEYVLALKRGADVADDDGHAPKKRRLDRPAEPNGTTAVSTGGDEAPVLLDVGELSFSVPRKKLRLELSATGLTGRNAGGAVECAVRWDDVEHATCVPVPDKAQRQHSFCLFPKGADGVTASTADAIVWTAPDAAPAAASGLELAAAEAAGVTDSYRSLLRWVFGRRGVRVEEPDEGEFASAIVQAHRRGESAVHVKGFRGSKEGYLFFLPTGILWAFKKPLLFFAFASVGSISYTSVLQRTFNLNIATGPADAAGAAEFEFAMLDQADFAGIDAYVRRHGLHDASMAEQRRARRVEVDGRGGGVEAGALAEAARLVAAEEGGGDGEDGEDEEEEEDYDPGSEGESEGSGSDSEEEGDGEGENEEEEDDEEEEKGG
ncbi:MAG: hypothetical protein M1832_000108 [Thelocarpon impressellum]|nr:MAG: hypothetical protein M1832_000108 [Thelocarpon impressellum]